jgi:hypothetical protein
MPHKLAATPVGVHSTIFNPGILGARQAMQ